MEGKTTGGQSPTSFPHAGPRPGVTWGSRDSGGKQATAEAVAREGVPSLKEASELQDRVHMETETT